MVSTTRGAVSLGVDIGTTNAKVVAIDADGVVVSRVIRPTPRDPGTLLIDAVALMDAVESMVLAACGEAYAVHAIACAGVGEDGVLLDAELRPLTRALAWFDPRRQRLFRELPESLRGDPGFDVASDPVSTLVGWHWARTQPSASDARAWSALADLPAVTWTRRPVMSDTLASRTSAWRASDRRWDADRVTVALGDLALLPSIVHAGEVVGALDSPRLAAAGVLAPDAVVVAGGHDHPIAGWGVDCLSPGVILDSMGTAEVVVTRAAASVERGADDDLAPGVGAEGLTLMRVEELARNVQWASQDPAVAARIRTLLEGSAEIAPVLGADYFRPGGRGGGQPSYALDVPADPHARASAVLVALAAAGRDAVAGVRAAIGPSAAGAEVRLAGGWTHSPGWLEIKAAVSGYRAAPILEPQVTAVGAAMLAAEARGWTPDPATALGGFTSMMLG
ncbi:FGGY family carbohydrate kinase [Schumannella sp. 10F1B-5-1]|uniref:FGGY family carbohydrate kinase n=1 Tax=Schumannella sp. 10F1B-5-1 TaxID=2590780 RepID=UPI001130C5C5|nr:FGGY family carbohydrate kinase [Schumannella sp. 10F1B-5-1]TPW71592.1 hypothetical protein FJ658_09530 [Schumannella sp. 10F1B-5-1]